MNALKHAKHIARRYADGGSNDETPAPPPLHGPIGIGNPVHSLTTQAPVLQIDPLQSPRGTAGTPHIEEPAPAPRSREDLAGQVAGQLVERYGDNHQAISERMLNLDPADHNGVLAALPPSVRNGVIDHRWNEASRLLGGQQEPQAPPLPQEAPRQPTASRTGYVSPYGIYGQSQLSDKEYESISHPEELNPFEGETYQGVSREQHPFSSLSQDALDSFQKYVKPKLGDVYNFAKKFFADYDTRNISVESAMHPEYGEGTLSFDGHLTDKGNHVADTSVSINPATNSAHLGLLEIDPAYRGVAGPKLLRNQIDAYKQMKLDYVDLYAAGGGDPYGGSYAWAKYGFVPNKQDWDMMRQRLSERLNRYEHLKPADPEVETVVKNILSNPDPRAIWRLSDVTAPTLTGQPLGKSLLLSHGWSGALNFKDTAAMERFDGYLKRPKKPKP